MIEDAAERGRRREGGEAGESRGVETWPRTGMHGMSCKKGAAASRGRVHNAVIAAAADADDSLSRTSPPPSTASRMLKTTSEVCEHDDARACEGEHEPATRHQQKHTHKNPKLHEKTVHLP
jgi:hypothetical protein